MTKCTEHNLLAHTTLSFLMYTTSAKRADPCTPKVVYQTENYTENDMTQITLYTLYTPLVALTYLLQLQSKEILLISLKVL